MNKSELISLAAAQSGVAKKDAQSAIDAAIDLIAAALAQGDKVQLSGFGVFEVKEREARMGRNPHTGEVVQIPATRVPNFKPSRALKDAVAE